MTAKLAEGDMNISLLSHVDDIKQIVDLSEQAIVACTKEDRSGEYPESILPL